MSSTPVVADRGEQPGDALGAGGVGRGPVVLGGERGAQLVVVEQVGEDLPALRGGELRGTRRRRRRRAGRPATRRAPGRGRRDRRPDRRRCAAPRRGSRGPAPGTGSRVRHLPPARPPPVAIGHALHPTISTGPRRTPRGTCELCQHASGGVPRVPSDADLDLDLPAEHAAQSCRRRSRVPARRRRAVPGEGDDRRTGHRARRRVHRRPRPRRRRPPGAVRAHAAGGRSRWCRSATTASRPRSCPTGSAAGSTRSSAGSTTSARGATAWSSSSTPASTSPSTCRSASA